MCLLYSTILRFSCFYIIAGKFYYITHLATASDNILRVLIEKPTKPNQTKPNECTTNEAQPTNETSESERVRTTC